MLKNTRFLLFQTYLAKFDPTRSKSTATPLIMKTFFDDPKVPVEIQGSLFCNVEFEPRAAAEDDDDEFHMNIGMDCFRKLKTVMLKFGKAYSTLELPVPTDYEEWHEVPGQVAFVMPGNPTGGTFVLMMQDFPVHRKFNMQNKCGRG